MRNAASARTHRGRRSGPSSARAAAARASRRPPFGRARADDRLDDAPLAQLLARDLLHDAPARHHDHAVAEPGELERIARLDDRRHAVRNLCAQRLVDVEARADVDALRRLLREDHLHVAAQERPHERHLLLVAAGERLDRLLRRAHADAQAAHEVVDRGALAAAADEAEPREPAEYLNRGVRPDAEDGEERLAAAVAAEEDDALPQRAER